ncbi:MAG TPA: xylulokinase [Jiangellaceae bacterium]|nr:xylulokinase [Jiangellaceae bacterium]
MPAVAGVDSSTQSCKVVVCDADTGEVLREGRASHPDGTEVHPRHWWSALQRASDGVLDGVAAVSVAAQQHGMVALDEAGDVVRPALLWNDTRSAGAARELIDELGGPKAWADAVGLVPVASFTVTKLRWLATHEPDVAARVARVLLPHDWLTWRLSGAGREPTTDRGDASGTGYWSAAEGRYRTDLLELALGSAVTVPRVAGPAEPVGVVADSTVGAAGAVVAAGTGDNMGAALGLGIEPGDVVVSLGTSGTVFAVAEAASNDAAGLVAGFADATGRFLPLVCTLNAGRVLASTATMLGTDLAGLDRLALHAAPGAGGLVMLPYMDGERTPDLPDATGSLMGMTRAAMSPSNLARASVEGMLCGLADGIDALVAQGVPVRRVLLIGGAAQSAAVRVVAPIVLGVPIVVPTPGEYVAHGAARQAAWALSGGPAPPAWPTPAGAVDAATAGATAADAERGREVRAAYARWRDFVHELR